MKRLIIKRLNLLICCLCVVVAYGYYAINDYMHYKDYDVTVVNTLTGTQGKGSSLLLYMNSKTVIDLANIFHRRCILQ
ncbi:thioredoxin [Escherichia phage FL23]